MKTSFLSTVRTARNAIRPVRQAEIDNFKDLLMTGMRGKPILDLDFKSRFTVKQLALDRVHNGSPDLANQASAKQREVVAGARTLLENMKKTRKIPFDAVLDNTLQLGCITGSIPGILALFTNVGIVPAVFVFAASHVASLAVSYFSYRIARVKVIRSLSVIAEELRAAKEDAK